MSNLQNSDFRRTCNLAVVAAVAAVGFVDVVGDIPHSPGSTGDVLACDFSVAVAVVVAAAVVDTAGSAFGHIAVVGTPQHGLSRIPFSVVVPILPVLLYGIGGTPLQRYRCPFSRRKNQYHTHKHTHT